MADSSDRVRATTANRRATDLLPVAHVDMHRRVGARNGLAEHAAKAGKEDFRTVPPPQRGDREQRGEYTDGDEDAARAHRTATSAATGGNAGRSRVAALSTAATRPSAMLTCQIVS